MKKYLLIILIGLISIPLLGLNIKADVYDDFPQYSFTDYDFTVYDLGNDYDALRIWDIPIENTSDLLYIVLPADADRKAVGSYISLYDDMTESWITLDLDDLLIPGHFITEEYRLTVRYRTTSPGYDFTGTNITMFRLQIALNQFVDGSTKLADYNDNPESWVRIPTVQFLLRFIDRLKVIDTLEIVGYPESIPIPTRAADPAGYKFVGWKSITGDYVIFDGPNQNWFVSEYFRVVNGVTQLDVYAYYSSTLSGLYTEPTQGPTDPGGILTLLDTFGLATNFGLSFVYIVILILMFIGLALLKVPLIVYFILTLGLTGIFMFLGYLPVFISIISIMIILITFFGIRQFSGGGTDE
jgi:hypothetical protein